MNMRTKAILQLLQFYQERQADIIAEKNLLLNPVRMPSILEKTKDAFCEVNKNVKD